MTADSPQDAQVAEMFIKHHAEYVQRAKDWVKLYANLEALEAGKLKTLMEMGFTEAQARVALEKTSWDEQAAINSLIGG